MLTEKFYTSDSDLESILPAPITEDVSQIKYVCKFSGCKKTFKRQTHLDRHEYHHDKIKKHICLFNDCDKSYIISTHLKRHIQTFHEKFRKPKSFKCSIPNCDKYFDSLFNVERHIANTHENCKTYKCKICDKEFARKMILKRHEIKQHNGNYPYKCDLCQKGYIQEVHLKNHKCLQKEPQYKCETCSEVFAKWTLLIEHSKKAHNKAFVCKCCNKEFQRKIDIQNHENSMKRKEEVKGLKIECPYEGCGRTYDFQKNLKHHIKVKHLCKKFKCPIENCEKELASKQKLNQHIKKMHEANAKSTEKNENKKKRKPRKDMGIPKKSYASQLSGLITTSAIEKKIIQGKADLIDVSARENEVSASEAESDDKILGTIVALEMEDF